MNDKTKRVFLGWLGLTTAERQELEKEIRRFLVSTESDQRQVRESTRSTVMKMDTGPLGTPCSCCGR